MGRSLMPDTLPSLVTAELTAPADPRAAAMAGALAARYPDASRAVLFYGSCLREENLDGLMLDFYLIVSDYREAYGKSWLATANRLIPPNVFPFEHNGLIAKYAVLSEADFARLLWAADDLARQRVVSAVASATPTLLSLARPMADAQDALSLWKAGFALTYNAELRAEKNGRSHSIVDADPDRYRRFGEAALADGLPPSPKDAPARWRELQRRGKRLSVIRLAKASFTYAGGIDYLAWKVNRHAGTAIVIKPWQRRWPLLGALTLLPRLFRGGAIR
jgi:hypothetical protein